MPSNEPPAPLPRRSVLDTLGARIAALGVILLVAVTLAWIHRDDLFPPEPVVRADDPAAACLAQRAADIDQMLRDGVIDESQATLFKSRAEALCQAQAGGGNAPPPPLPAN